MWIWVEFGLISKDIFVQIKPSFPCNVSNALRLLTVALPNGSSKSCWLNKAKFVRWLPKGQPPTGHSVSSVSGGECGESTFIAFEYLSCMILRWDLQCVELVEIRQSCDNLVLDGCTEWGKGLEVILKLAVSLDKEAVLVGLLS